MSGTDTLARAATFVWSNARLVDRRLFAYHFGTGSAESVVSALRAYVNDDGGLGHALEPDMRCPDSQPVAQEMGLRVLDEVGFDGGVVQGVCEFLMSITTDAGGVPNVLATVMGYPHAPWWNATEEPPASLNPTAALAGLLHKHAVEHPWVERATAYCWEKIEKEEEEEPNALLCVITVLENVPDQQRARAAFASIGERILDKGLVCMDADSPEYVKKPLDWAPTPGSWCRELFSDGAIDQHLRALATQQQDDGGWAISWPAVSPACELEWRGQLTVQTLKVLKDYGRLEA
jgi:hypothetical protein